MIPFTDDDVTSLRRHAEAQRREHPDKIGQSENLRGPFPCPCYACAYSRRVLRVLDELDRLRAEPLAPPVTCATCRWWVVDEQSAAQRGFCRCSYSDAVKPRATFGCVFHEPLAEPVTAAPPTPVCEICRDIENNPNVPAAICRDHYRQVIEADAEGDRVIEDLQAKLREVTAAPNYYHEAAKAFEALARIVRAYDRYRGRGVIPAPDEYQGLVDAINAARSIMGPQFKLSAEPVTAAETPRHGTATELEIARPSAPGKMLEVRADGIYEDGQKIRGLPTIAERLQVLGSVPREAPPDLIERAKAIEACEAVEAMWSFHSVAPSAAANCVTAIKALPSAAREAAR